MTFHPSKAYIQAMVCLQDITCLCLFALLLQCLILIPYLAKVLVFPQTTRDIAYRLLDLLTYSMPISLPTVMLLVAAVAGKRLSMAGIELMFPEVLKHGAAVDVVCFDKTGTLTQSAVSSALKPSETACVIIITILIVVVIMLSNS